MSDKLPEFFDKFIQKMLPNIREGANSKMGVMPVAFVGSTETGKMGVVRLDFSGNTFAEVAKAKDACGNAIRRIAQATEADFVIFVSESWTVPQEHVKEFMDNRDKYPSVESFPHRAEMVMISVETGTTTWLGKCSLSGVQGDRIVGEPEFFKADRYEGRFAQFLGPKVVH
jgi:hypothetical protein